MTKNTGADNPTFAGARTQWLPSLAACPRLADTARGIGQTLSAVTTRGKGSPRQFFRGKQ